MSVASLVHKEFTLNYSLLHWSLSRTLAWATYCTLAFSFKTLETLTVISTHISILNAYEGNLKPGSDLLSLVDFALSALARPVVENPQPPAQTPWHIKRAEHCRRGTDRRSASNNVRTTINRLVIKNEIIDRVLSTLYVKEMRVLDFIVYWFYLDFTFSALVPVGTWPSWRTRSTKSAPSPSSASSASSKWKMGKMATSQYYPVLLANERC